jgi:hypothetical protein
LLGWSLNLSTKLSADPAAYGLSAEQAAEFAAVHQAFADAMAAVDPAIRSKVSVARKNDARDVLKAQARLLVSIIQGQASVTDSQKIELGLTVRRAPRAIPAPLDPPGVLVTYVVGQTVHLRLYDFVTARRGKPPGVRDATIFSFVGDEPPASLSEWTLQCNCTRTQIDIHFPSTLPPGTKVWFCAYWLNPRSQRGPVSKPVGTHIQGGIVVFHQNGLSAAA